MLYKGPWGCNLRLCSYRDWAIRCIYACLAQSSRRCLAEEEKLKIIISYRWSTREYCELYSPRSNNRINFMWTSMWKIIAGLVGVARTLWREKKEQRRLERCCTYWSRCMYDSIHVHNTSSCSFFCDVPTKTKGTRRRMKKDVGIYNTCISYLKSGVPKI